MRKATASSEGLQIETIHISAAYPRLSAKGMEDWYHILVSVHNLSPTQTYQVISSLRGMDYDAASLTLLIQMIETSGSGEDSFHIHPLTPSYTEVAPGGTETLAVSVPKVIKKIHLSRSGGLGSSIEPIDISGLKQVQCQIGYREPPLGPKPSESPQQMQSRLQASYRITERTMPPGPAPSD